MAYGLIKNIFYINPFPQAPRNPLVGFYVFVIWYDVVPPVTASYTSVRLSGRTSVWPLINAVPTNYVVIPKDDGLLTLIDQERQYV